MTDRIIDDFNDLIATIEMPTGKRKVIISAVKLFSDQGFNGTSTAQISELSGMSEATIFKYFKTKRGLLEAIINPLMDDLIPSYGQEFIQKRVPQNQDFEQTIQFIVNDRLTFIYDNRLILQILMSEALVNDDLLNRLRQKFTPIIKQLSSALESLIPNSEISIVDLFRLLVGQIFFEFMRITKFGNVKNYDIQIVADKITKSIVAMV
ncbi:putative transcriptional regulator [Weissella koreensis KACC 15510]|uniref:TetR/AcrR family transcriptional regulator n=1 Tax=Weissella koreensis TaxID=165096 RepID=UPI0002175885|nr:TetR/AcrR family transcriptional regulator [Weissella koreensis]AEJ22934.1 putative transcriptional regulator [Weissella koreensis KACC 15510]